MIKYIFIAIVFLPWSFSHAQQAVDTSFQVTIQKPHYFSENAPKVFIDAMHNNLHKENSNFAPFAKLARKDGYQVSSMEQWEDIDLADLLVIANALNEKNMGNWQRPIYPAFKAEEIARIVNFVERGGSLLLIADHMPFAGAASDLAEAFGFDLCDGFAQLKKTGNRPDAFSIANGRLLPSILTDGTMGKEVTQVITFTGSSFDMPNEAIGVLKLLEGDICRKPEVAWQFGDSTPQENLENKYQGAIMSYGQGKIAVFGEAAMFTAQTIAQNGNTFQVGFNAPFASENIEFIRNLLLWLTKD